MADQEQPLDLSKRRHHTCKGSKTRFWAEQYPTEEQHVHAPEVPASRVPSAYCRYPKPPYPYMGMVTVAILSSPKKRLVVAEIFQAIREMFAFFRGEYQGWRRTVRGVLSRRKCFVIKRFNNIFYWTVDISLLPPNALLRASLRDEQKRCQWAPTLTRQLGIPDINLPSLNIPKEGRSQKTTQQTDLQQKLNTTRAPEAVAINSVSEHQEPRLDHHSSVTYQPQTQRSTHRREDQRLPSVNQHLHQSQPESESLVHCPCMQEQYFPPYAAMLYNSFASRTIPARSLMCPPANYDGGLALQCACHDFLPVEEVQPVFRLRLDDWNMHSMQS